MLITKISHQIKNPDRANVFVDGKYSFSLNLYQVIETKIESGLEIDENDLKHYKKISDDGKLKLRALEWLSLRPHSQKELIDYLKRKKLEADQINVWVKDFQKMGYQNDTTFTNWWVEQRKNKLKSIRFIRQELTRKGIDNNLINEAMKSTTNDKAVLKLLINKKRKLSKYKDDKKLIQYLIRQGYNYSLIKELVAE